jgi:ABC-type Fe3+/spermidine/putrescine transport system ATPase subunit
MLEMSQLSKAYRTEIFETYALRDFSLQVKEGEFVAVTGPSGSGKTTFLTIAGLLEEFTSGEYELDGVAVRGLSDRQRSRLRNEKLGFIFQAFNLISDLNIEEMSMCRCGTGGSIVRKDTAASGMHWSVWDWVHVPGTIRLSSPVGSSSAPRSLAHWPALRASCWLTSRRAISIHRWPEA